MSTASAAEVQKNFGAFREAALTEPVVVTAYGKPSVVIVSATEYERLKELDRRVVRLEDWTEADLEALLASEIPEEYRYSVDDIPGDRA